MSINYPRPHHGSASEFQVHGFPFVTSSINNEVVTSGPVKVTFPYVTQFVQITNTGNSKLLVGFSENGVTGSVTTNRLQIPPSGSSMSPVLPIKCREIFFLTDVGTTSFTLLAGLTNVTEFPVMSGSTGFDGVG